MASKTSKGFSLKQFLSFLGLGFLVTVGFIDPGSGKGGSREACSVTAPRQLFIRNHRDHALAESNPVT